MLRIKYTVREKETGSWIIFFLLFNDHLHPLPSRYLCYFHSFLSASPLLIALPSSFYSFPLPKNIGSSSFPRYFFEGFAPPGFIPSSFYQIERSISTYNGKWSNLDFNFNSCLLLSDYPLRLGATRVQFSSKYVKDSWSGLDFSFSTARIAFNSFNDNLRADTVPSS